MRKRVDIPKLRTTAGWLIYSTNNAMGGGSTRRIHEPGPAWLSQHLWAHYEYTGDQDFLRTEAYPVLKDLSEYWLGHLLPDADGRLISPTALSPEHGPAGDPPMRTQPGASYDQQIVWDLFFNTLAAATELGIDEDFRTRLAIASSAPASAARDNCRNGARTGMIRKTNTAIPRTCSPSSPAGRSPRRKPWPSPTRPPSR